MSLRAQAIAEGFKYIARRGSKIVAFASTKAEAAREGTPEKLPSVPAKYLRGFKGKARVQRVREILRERRRGTFEPLPSDKGVSTKRSKWSVQFEQTYGERPDDIADVARLTGVPRAVLKQVYDRGLAAWSTGGHRPGASQHGWAMARVQSFVLGGPTTRTADKDLVKPLTANPIRLKGGDETRQFANIVAEAYAAAPDYDPRAVESYKALGRSIEKIYKQILSRVEVKFVKGQPYESDEQMAREVQRTGVLYISKDFNEHPIYTPEQNLKARAVHDWFAHILPGADFSQRGELKAYNRQMKLTPKKAWPALFTEVVGQAAYATVHGEFPEQKIAILDGFDYYNVGQGPAVEAAKARGVVGVAERDPTQDYTFLDLAKNPRTLKDRIKEVQALNLGLVQVSVDPDPYKAYCVIDSTGEVVGALATMPPPPMEVLGEDGVIYTTRCWDAPMVFFSVVSRDYQGKGLGGLLYLWAMAAGDGLFPDRAGVRAKASRVWERLYEMDETVWFEFDNIDAPQTHRFEDDCIVYGVPDEEYLDGVYELKHSDAMKVLRAVKPLLKKGEQYRGDLSDNSLYEAAIFLFESVY